jgi:replicative DNA helicase
MSEFLRAKDIRDPRSLNVTDYLELKNVSKKLAELPLWVDDNSRLSLDKILARARLAIARYGVRIIVLDYLQIVEVPDVKDDVQRLDRVTYRLRDLAKTEKGVHVIALSQHSYGEDSKGKKRLKGSSSLMQSCQNLFELRTEEESSDAEIAIRKQREGRRGRVSCRYDADSLSFVA